MSATYYNNHRPNSDENQLHASNMVYLDSTPETLHGCAVKSAVKRQNPIMNNKARQLYDPEQDITII